MELNRIEIPFKIKKPILALGSQAKNTLCFGKGNFAYLSALHPDLSNPADFMGFQRTVKYFLKKGPKIIAYDLHPEYQSNKYALGLNANRPPSPRLRRTVPRSFSEGGRYTLSAIQHHHAHIASCMLENNLHNEKVIGVAFDGTGLGSDNHLWGAEFIISNYKDFKRAAHLKEIPLLGGEKAILEPARLAIAWLYLIYKDKFLSLGIDLIKKIGKSKCQVLKNMYLSGFNSPLASSMGRLFDAVASLVLGKTRVNREGELAIGLEKAAGRYPLPATSYRFNIIKNKDEYIIDPRPMFKEIIKDLKAKRAKERIAYRFHLTVAQMISKMSLVLREETRINKVVLSGGVFQNNLLLRLALDLLYKEDFKVFTHKNLSCNDSGISLGQVAVANFRS